MSEALPAPAPAPAGTEAEAPADARPGRRFGRRRVEAHLVLSPDQRRRQAVVMRLAMDLLPSAGDVVTFLNTPHADLGGRPLDLAVDSDDGLAAVEASLRAPLRPADPGA